MTSWLASRVCKGWRPILVSEHRPYSPFPSASKNAPHLTFARCPPQHKQCEDDWRPSESPTPPELLVFTPDEPPAQNLGNNWAQNKDLWVDRTYIVHSTSLWINIPNHEALTCNHWAFLSLRRHISHNLAFSSHLTDTTSNQLQSLPVKPHFCCPEASDSLPARTQEWVKIKGDFFCHYPVWTPTYAEGEGRFFPEKRRRDRMSRAAWNPIMTADIKKKKKTGRKSSSCHIVVYESPESLSAPQQICAPWQPHESTRSLLRFKAKPTKRSALVEAWGNVILLKIAFLSQTIRFHYFRFSF